MSTGSSLLNYSHTLTLYRFCPLLDLLIFEKMIEIFHSDDFPIIFVRFFGL